MTAVEIPPIVLLVDPDPESLERYSRQFEDAGFWVATTTAYDELLPSVDELRPDVIIADAYAEADADTRTRRQAALDALKHSPQCSGVPLVVLVPPRAEQTPDADVTLRKPVPEGLRPVLLQPRRADLDPTGVIITRCARSLE